MGEDFNGLKWIMLWCRKTRPSEMRTGNFTEVKQVHPTWRYDQCKRLFDKNDRSAETRGSGKMCSSPDANRWFLTVLYPTGGSGRTWRCRQKPRWKHFINIWKLKLYVKMAKKHQKRSFLIDDCGGPTEGTVLYQVAEALPMGWEHFYTICDAERRRQHL